MQDNEMLETFLAESRELLADMEEALLQLEERPDDPELPHRVFRAAHTIKGSAGLFAREAAVPFAHEMESVLGRVREHELSVDAELIAVLLECGDHLGTLCGIEGPAPDALRHRGDALVARLRHYLGEPAGVASAPAGAGTPEAVAGTAGEWTVSFRFEPDVLACGIDPLAFARHLGGLGTLRQVTPSWDDRCGLAALEPERCYLGLSVVLDAQTTAAALEDVFEFVREDVDLTITPPSAPDTEVSESPVQGGREPAAAAAATAQPAVSFLRVRSDKLDALVDLVGELVVASAAVATEGRAAGGRLAESSEILSGLVEQLREVSLSVRTVPVGETFRRFQRIVRDTGRQLGKDIELVIEGGDTELDKTVVERIVDPLTHLVRNAVDHGIEDAGRRRAAGKPAVGRVRLNAYHEAGHVVLEIEDDGAGMDPERVRARAEARGLVEPGTEIDERAMLQVIFEPGFSTADRVSDVSGRGVGMDVVRRNIEALRGTIELDTTPGAGTRFRIRLPLTLAIIDGFLLEVAGTPYVLPLDAVVECVELPGGHRGEVLPLRGHALPLIALNRALGHTGPEARRRNVVVIRHEGALYGLVVDRLLGEHQTVLKPLGRVFDRLECVSGATVLGSGEVALILDVARVTAQAIAREELAWAG
ncbi:Chemotaxis protein CheA [wastewater metagenome]|uniref:Chemotaxis protein CheA n=2 Tax=unclassified sequences TaxID=12908 RepID=A0A5B8RCI5_9ZZZZ|nr:chemotaxis protein CheA [Arhodomonas sp. KWT]QEA05184.1 chemotaxis protein CheA [uncultured organism]